MLPKAKDVFASNKCNIFKYCDIFQSIRAHSLSMKNLNLKKTRIVILNLYRYIIKFKQFKHPFKQREKISLRKMFEKSENNIIAVQEEND